MTESTDNVPHETSNKPFPNFLGKIERGTEADLKDAVSVTEKMDGSYFQFGWYKGEFRYRTKNTLDNEGISDKMFQKVIRELVDNKDSFLKDIVFCCEYFKSQKHNSISYYFSHKYGHIDKDECFLFVIEAVFTEKEDDIYKSWYYYEKKIGNCYMSNVPKIMVNEIGDINSAVMGEHGAIREGIVIKKKDGTRLKFVSDHFKEVACKKKRPQRQCQEVSQVWEPYIEGLRARVDKAIFRLKESGIELDKSVFGKVLSYTVNDLLEEENGNIKEELFKFYEKSFKKKVNARIIEILLNTGVEPMTC